MVSTTKNPLELISFLENILEETIIGMLQQSMWPLSGHSISTQLSTKLELRYFISSNQLKISFLGSLMPPFTTSYLRFTILHLNSPLLNCPIARYQVLQRFLRFFFPSHPLGLSRFSLLPELTKIFYFCNLRRIACERV